MPLKYKTKIVIKTKYICDNVDMEEYIELNAKLAQDWPVIDSKCPPLPEAEEWADLPNKRDQLIEHL